MFYFWLYELTVVIQDLRPNVNPFLNGLTWELIEGKLSKYTKLRIWDAWQI